MAEPRKVARVDIYFSDGEKMQVVMEEDGYYLERVNHDSARDEHNKNRKERHQWINHEVHWKSDVKPVPKATEQQ